MNLVDSDVWIDLLRGVEEAKDWFLAQDGAKAIAMPGYVALELLDGCRSKNEMKPVLSLLKRVQIQWLQAHGCQMARGYIEKYRVSHGIGVLDCLIAACATSARVTLYTFNDKHFQCIPALKLARPYKKP